MNKNLNNITQERMDGSNDSNIILLQNTQVENQKTFYVTTPIFYPTGAPHIGTAYTVFIADTLARYYRSKLGSENVFFITGTDEHGGNIAKKAKEESKTPQEYVDNFANLYKEKWESLNISYQYFNRTTNPQHEKFIQDLIQKSYDNGDLYEGEYSGWYCESCEAYYKEEDLVEGKCPNHPTKAPTFTKEKNYYFRLSKYRDWLLGYLKENPKFIQPKKWYDYILGLVEAGLQDIPVTRANVKWGVPVPWDITQTIYVWYDALPNYLSILNYSQFDGYQERFWPESHHIVGKDILRFHAILWPAMLKSANLSLPKKIISHGFFTVDGQKIGKSNNNAIDPIEIAKIYTNDAVRYALLSEFQLGNDGDFSFDRLEVKYNSDLANNFGNLLNRIIHLTNKKGLNLKDLVIEKDFKLKVDQFKLDYEKHFENFEIFDAILVVTNLCTWGNQYTNDNKPWEGGSNAEVTLGNLGYLLKTVIELFSPIIPESSEKAKIALEKQDTIILFPKLQKEKKPANPESEPTAKPAELEVDLKNLNLKALIKPIQIVKVLNVSQHPNADKLKIVEVDLGDHKKNVITGADNMQIGDFVPYIGEHNIIPGYLLMNGEKIILKKKPLRGIDSDSMILAEDEIGLSADHAGIYILPNQAENLGKSLIDILTDEEWSKIKLNYQKFLER